MERVLDYLNIEQLWLALDLVLADRNGGRDGKRNYARNRVFECAY